MTPATSATICERSLSLPPDGSAKFSPGTNGPAKNWFRKWSRLQSDNPPEHHVVRKRQRRSVCREGNKPRFRNLGLQSSYSDIHQLDCGFSVAYPIHFP